MVLLTAVLGVEPCRRCPIQSAIDRWTESAPVVNGSLFRSVRKNGTVWGDGITQNVVWYVVKAGAARAGITALAPTTQENLCEIVSRSGRRTGADSISAGTRIRPDYRTVHRMQAEPGLCGQRSAAVRRRRLPTRRGFRNSYQPPPVSAWPGRTCLRRSGYSPTPVDAVRLDWRHRIVWSFIPPES